MGGKKIFGTIAFVVALIVIVVGVTFAWYTWTTSVGEQTNVSFTVTGINTSDITYNSSNNNVKLMPVSDKSLGNITTATVSTTYSTATLYGTYTLTPITLPATLTVSNFNWSLTSDHTGVETQIGSGNFSGAVVDTPITLNVDQETLKATNVTYKLYLWLDGPSTTNVNTQNVTWEFELVLDVTDQPQ